MKNWRFVFIQILFIVLAAALVGRLLYWHVVKHDSLVAKAEEEGGITTIIEATRGKIFSSDGSILVGNEPAFLLFANLNEFKESYFETDGIEKIAKEIAEALLPEILQNQKDPKKLSESEKESIFDEEEKRIIQKAKKDPQSFGILFDEYYPKIFGYIHRRIWILSWQKI